MFYRPSKESALSILAFVGLGIVAVTSVVLWLSGSRFARRHVALHRAMPRLTWMFRQTDDDELERNRRRALVLLPLLLAGAVLYLAFSGPSA